MIQFKLAYHHLVKNKNQSLPFIFSNTIWVAVVYIFLAMLYDTNLKNISFGAIAVALMQLGLGFVILVSGLAIIYAEQTLSKQRTKELGLYSMLGLNKHNLRQVIGIENLLFYAISTGLGLIIGITFSKLSVMSLRVLLNFEHLHQTLTIKPIAIAAIIFAIIFLLLTLYDFWGLRHINPITLWHKSSKAETVPKGHTFLAITGLIVLIMGYYISISSRASLSAFLQMMVAIMLVVVGTYLIFIIGSIVFLKLLKQNENYYYKPKNFIAVANMLFRMKQNGAGLATISLLCTATLVSIIASVSLVAGQNNLLNLWSQRDIQIVSRSPINLVQNEQITQFASKTNISLQSRRQMTVTMPTNGELKNNYFKANNSLKTEVAISSLDLQQYNHIEGTHYHLADDEILLYSPDNTYQGKEIIIHGHKYKVKPVTSFNTSFVYNHSTYKPIFIIAKSQAIAQKINPTPVLYVTSFNTVGTKSACKQFGEKLPNLLNADPASITSRFVIKDLFGSLFGGFLFIGVLISLVMICATAMIIYYKQVSEGYSDKANYAIMRQLGLSQQETRKAINSQVLTVFLLPIVGAVINLAFALPVLKNVLSVFSMYNINILISVSFICIALLIIIYMLIYWATTVVYKQIIVS